MEDVLLVAPVGHADEELEEVHERAAGEGVLVAAALVAQVRVALVVEHLVGRQVHAGVQDLRREAALVVDICGYWIVNMIKEIIRRNLGTECI